MTLHLLNSLLEADVAMVLRQLVGCQCLVPVLSVQEDLLQDVKTQLEELAVAYLSLLPDGLCSSMSVAGQTGLDQYYCDAYSLVSNLHIDIARLVTHIDIARLVTYT